MLYYSVQDGKTDSILKIQSVPEQLLKVLWKAITIQLFAIQHLLQLIFGHLQVPIFQVILKKQPREPGLRDKKLDDCIEFCLTSDFTEKIPVMKNGILVDIIYMKL